MNAVEAAVKFGVTRRTIINWIAEGRLTATKELGQRKTNAWVITGSPIAWIDQRLSGHALPSSATPITNSRVNQETAYHDQDNSRPPIHQPPTQAEQVPVPPAPPVRYVPVDDAQNDIDAQRRAIRDSATALDRPPIRPNPISKLRRT